MQKYCLKFKVIVVFIAQVLLISNAAFGGIVSYSRNNLDCLSPKLSMGNIARIKHFNDSMPVSGWETGDEITAVKNFRLVYAERVGKHRTIALVDKDGQVLNFLPEKYSNINKGKITKINDRELIVAVEDESGYRGYSDVYYLSPLQEQGLLIASGMELDSSEGWVKVIETDNGKVVALKDPDGYSDVYYVLQSQNKVAMISKFIELAKDWTRILTLGNGELLFVLKHTDNARELVVVSDDKKGNIIAKSVSSFVGEEAMQYITAKIEQVSIEQAI
ncbi:MAG: hypothetical protein L6416_02420 [Candidatus Omnitrophica bacterium]|nr:hypothetical protein [Candidatus Omnitrophota bacterium]